MADSWIASLGTLPPSDVHYFLDAPGSESLKGRKPFQHIVWNHEPLQPHPVSPERHDGQGLRETRDYSIQPKLAGWVSRGRPLPL